MDKKSLIRPELANYGAAKNLAFNDRIKQLIKEGEKIYHFAFGQSPFPVCRPMVEALKEEVHQSEYIPVAGIADLREGICQFHKDYDGMDFIKPDQVVVGPGSKELIFLLLQVFNGDVLIVSPSWTSYSQQSTFANKRTFKVVTDMEHQWKITPDMIAKTIKENNIHQNKLLIFCNPCNPTGTSYTKEELINIANFCRENSIIVLADEIYAQLHYHQDHHSITTYYPEGSILNSGFSKWASAGGWRIGYAIFPEELSILRNYVSNGGSHTYSCAPAPMQYAIAKTLLHKRPECDSYMKHSSRVLQAVGMYCYRELTSIGAKAIAPTAGYYFVPDFEMCREGFRRRGILTGPQMCDAMLKECNVALMSTGPTFVRPDEELSVRFCFVCFDGRKALEYSEELGLETPLPDDFITNYALPVHEGVQALKQWLLKHKVD